MQRDPEIRRPIGAGVTNEELEKMITVHRQAAYERRMEAEVQWLIARCTLDGFPYHEADWKLRTLNYNRMNPKGSMRVDIPETVNRMRREMGRLLSMYRPPTTEPVPTGKLDIYRLNRFAKAGVAYIHEATRFEETKLIGLIANGLTDGIAFLYPHWTRFYEPQPDGEDGDADFRVIPAWQIFPFPGDAVSDDTTQGIIWERPVSKEFVAANFPEAMSSAKTVIVTSPYEAAGSSSDGLQRQREGYIVREVFFKPSRRLPQGEHLWMVGDKIYKREGQLNFSIGRRRVIPIFPWRWCERSTSWWGLNFGYQVARLNKEINREMSLLVRRAVMKAHPGYLMTPMGACNVEDFKTQIGGVVQYRPSLINPEASRPYWLTFQASTTDTDVVVNRLNSYMQDLTSQHEATEGNSAGRVDSAAGLQALVRQDVVPSEVTIKSLKSCINQSFGLALAIGRAKWKQPKIGAIAGPAGMGRTALLVDPRNIPTLEDIRIISSLDLPMDRMALLQFGTNLASAPTRDSQPILTQQEYRRLVVALGVNLPGVDLIDPNEETAWRENLLLYNDGMTPGQIASPDSMLEDLRVHIETHRAFAATMEVHAASDAVRLAFQQHIRETAELLNGAAIPDGADAELVRADSEMLTHEIELAQMGARALPEAGNPPLEVILAQALGGGGGMPAAGAA